MLFIIYGIDKEGVERDPEVMKAHVEYLGASSIKNIVSGPLVSDDGEDVVGSFYMVEAEDRAQIEAFQKDDPLVHAGYWQSVDVRAFNKRVDNRD